MLSPVRDQAKLGACSGFALSALVESMCNEYLHDKSIRQKFPLTIVSPRFVYYWERWLEGGNINIEYMKEDAGAQIRTGLKVLTSIGVSPEALDQYDPVMFAQSPSPQADAAASAFKIRAYYRVNNLRELQRTIAWGHPVVIGISIFESFDSREVARTGIVPMPKRNEACLGGHAVLACGYDMAKEQVLVKNSWGAEWGIGGYFQLPFAYWTGGEGMVWDMWSAVR
jgi:C1A family cysteine protease